MSQEEIKKSLNKSRLERDTQKRQEHTPKPLSPETYLRKVTPGKKDTLSRGH